MEIDDLADTRTKYAKIMQDIRGKIISGEFAVDSKLPSEEKLESSYSVSRVTIRLAIDGLVKDGLVERVQGKGSFVRKPSKLSRLVRSTTVESFSEVAKEYGFQVKTHVIKIETVTVNDKLRTMLETDANEALHIVRLRYLDSDPIFLESNYFPLPKFEQLPNYNLHNSLYDIFKTSFGIKELFSDDTTLSVISADVEKATLLKKSVGFPLFFLETQIKEQDGIVVQYGEQFITSDRYKFKI